MEPAELKTPPKTQTDHSENAVVDCESPPRPLAPTGDCGYEPMKKICTPDRLSVPKAFKFPERYRSPTDAMMSPVTKGLLARNRKAPGSLLPPSLNQTKIQDLRTPETGLFQNEVSSVGC
ncbi:PREDICTED: uncharacterized protein LOC104822332 [Tarenaya hassleriana]|uniref:uncharacterized protein LOC104822332 n=1 Tax=Tarenaya hassleriana TaxID=28532 RepID=UPI00053C7F26|nr:PREDICTED: uncharacterized protein LOC104822332 [Tarenaya hassleriana]